MESTLLRTTKNHLRYLKTTCKYYRILQEKEIHNLKEEGIGVY